MSELEKILKVREAAQSIGLFLDCLSDMGLILCDTKEEDKVCDDRGYWPTSRSIDTILHEYFEIDPDKAEQERREILEEARRLNKETNNG